MEQLERMEKNAKVLAYLFHDPNNPYSSSINQLKKWKEDLKELDDDIERFERKGLNTEHSKIKKRKMLSDIEQHDDWLIDNAMDSVSDSLEEGTYKINQFLFLKKNVKDYPFELYSTKSPSHYLERSMSNFKPWDEMKTPNDFFIYNYIFRDKSILERMEDGAKPFTKKALSLFNKKNYDKTLFHLRKGGVMDYDTMRISGRDDFMIELFPIELGNHACRWKVNDYPPFKKVDIESRDRISRDIYDRLMDIDGKSEEFSVTDKKKLMRAEFCTLERMMENAILQEEIKKNGSYYLDRFLKEYDDMGLVNTSRHLYRTIIPITYPSINNINLLARESRYYNVLEKAFDERKKRAYDVQEKKFQNDDAELKMMDSGVKYINSLKKKELEKLERKN